MLAKQESVDDLKKAPTPIVQNLKNAQENVYSETPSSKPATPNPGVTCSVINELSAQQLIKKAGTATAPASAATTDKISPTAVVVSNGKTPNPNPNAIKVSFVEARFA